jgi:hypothetical protein
MCKAPKSRSSRQYVNTRKKSKRRKEQVPPSVEQEKCNFPFARRKEKRNGSVDDWVLVKSWPSKGLFFTLTILTLIPEASPKRDVGLEGANFACSMKSDNAP